MNLKQLYDNKQKYSEYKRVYEQKIRESLQESYFESYQKIPTEDIIVNFKENGVYSSPELVVSSSSQTLTDKIINKIKREYDLEVTYKSITTGLNMLTDEISQTAKVHFKHSTKNTNNILDNIIITYNSKKIGKI